MVAGYCLGFKNGRDFVRSEKPGKLFGTEQEAAQALERMAAHGDRLMVKPVIQKAQDERATA